MLTVLQRVSNANVTIDEMVVAQITTGLVILCGFEQHDNQLTLVRMLEKCLNYRIFNDEQGKMNLSLQKVNGSLLLVPQFTLMADTNKGLRPSFSKAAPPAVGQGLFNELLVLAQANHSPVASGQFGADMQVNLCNDGPVTFVMRF